MPTAGEEQQAGSLRHRRVLIVEDEALVAMLLEDELTDAGAKPLGPAASLEQAFQQVEASLADGGLDAAVLDGRLGGETVLPLADLLEYLSVPFVFASGYGDNLERGRHAAVPVLAKPFNAGALIAALQAIMARR